MCQRQLSVQMFFLIFMLPTTCKMNMTHALRQVQMHKNQFQPDMAVSFHQDNGGLMRLPSTPPEYELISTYFPMKEHYEWLIVIRYYVSDSTSCS